MRRALLPPSLASQRYAYQQTLVMLVASHAYCVVSLFQVFSPACAKASTSNRKTQTHSPGRQLLQALAVKPG